MHLPSQTRDMVLAVLGIVCRDPGAAQLDALTLEAIQVLLDYLREDVDGPQ